MKSKYTTIYHQCFKAVSHSGRNTFDGIKYLDGTGATV